jgi:hypothetical protein
MAALALAVWMALLPAAGLLDTGVHSGSQDAGLFEWQPSLCSVSAAARGPLQRACLPRATAAEWQVPAHDGLPARTASHAAAASLPDQPVFVLRI